jgi:hypothetical protein
MTPSVIAQNGPSLPHTSILPQLQSPPERVLKHPDKMPQCSLGEGISMWADPLCVCRHLGERNLPADHKDWL